MSEQEQLRASNRPRSTWVRANRIAPTFKAYVAVFTFMRTINEKQLI